MKYIPLEQLREPPNPMRLTMDDEKLAELIDDIKAQGILQNLVVVVLPGEVLHVGETRESDSEGTFDHDVPVYEIVAGHRRYKAACAAGIKSAPCLVFTDATLAKHAAMSAENTLREDVSPAEEAYWYAELIDKLDVTEEQLTKTVRKPLSYIYKRLDLLRGHPAVLEAVKERQITLSVAEQLNRVDNAEHCAYLTRMAVEGGVTARVAMDWVQQYKKTGPSPVIDFTPFRRAGEAGQAVVQQTKCFLCKSANYPANIVWVPIHDFERDQLLAQIEGVATPPAEVE
jgi:ParB family transcriptional regulator, chromosome partitioning protein